MADACADLLLALEARLKHVEDCLQSNDNAPAPATTTDASAQPSILARLHEIQDRLAAFCSNNPVAAEILRLHATHPDLFRQGKDPPHRPTIAEQLPVLMSSAASFPAVMSQLNELQATSFPDSAAFTRLLALQPRLECAHALHQAQEAEIAELRQRSASVLTQWYAGTVLLGGEQWSIWEQKLMKVEQKLRREATALSRREVP